MSDAPSPSTADAGSSSSTESDPSAIIKPNQYLGKHFGGARCLRRGRESSILSHNQNLCVLVAVAVARSSSRFADLRNSISELCTAHSWVRVALNLFDEVPSTTLAADLHSAGTPGGLHSCVSLSTIAAFKTRFWQQALLPTRLHGITHLFLVDSDMDIRPAHFDFVTLVRLSQATNVSILSPAPYGGGNGFYHLDAPRLNNNYALTKAHCGGKPSDWAYNCPVCRQSVVEVKAPLFTIAAWSVLFQRVLSRMPASTLVGTPEWIDLMWCQLMAHHLDGCDPSKQMGLPFGSDNCIGRNSCAYSYITPIKHNNDLEIEQRNRSRATGADPTRFTEVWLDKNAEKKRYFMAPSWRPKGSYLRNEPCWSMANVSEALGNWSNESALVPQLSELQMARQQRSKAGPPKKKEEPKKKQEAKKKAVDKAPKKPSKPAAKAASSKRKPPLELGESSVVGSFR